MQRLFPRLGPPPDASLGGHDVDAMLRLTAMLTGACLVVVLVALAWMLVVYRARVGHRAVPVRGDTRAHALVVAVLVAIVFVGLDANLARLAHADLTSRIANVPRGTGVLRVEVMPQRFAWNVRLAGRDERFGSPDDIVTLNDLRIPVSTPVVVQLRAKDVIHSFFVPAFRIKQDAIPGRVTRTWFEAVALGRFEIACAQLCGFAHDQMRGEVHVSTRADWQRWYDSAAADARRAYVADDDEAHWGWTWVDR